MNITISQAQGKEEITVIKLDGQLDGQNYQDLIAKAKELYEGGARQFILDLAGLSFISSAGLVALHSLALLTTGEALPDGEEGWSTIHSTRTAGAGGPQKHVKLLNPQEAVNSVLEMVGFSQAFEIFSDFDEAVNSF